MTAWVMHEPVGDRPETKGDPILMRGDYVAVVTWLNRFDDAVEQETSEPV